jgi:hypothetical protein
LTDPKQIGKLWFTIFFSFGQSFPTFLSLGSITDKIEVNISNFEKKSAFNLKILTNRFLGGLVVP